MTHKVFGIVGWKNSGKTTLVARLVKEFTRRGYTVSTIKHAHHAFDIDQPGRDSYRFREAGARQVVLVSGRRWALMHELRGEEPPTFEEMLDHIGDCDLVLVEGFKRGPFPKIEARSARSLTRDALSEDDPRIVAIADETGAGGNGLPCFNPQDVPAIADFIVDHLGLARR